MAMATGKAVAVISPVRLISGVGCPQLSALRLLFCARRFGAGASKCCQHRVIAEFVPSAPRWIPLGALRTETSRSCLGFVCLWCCTTVVPALCFAPQLAFRKASLFRGYLDYLKLMRNQQTSFDSLF